MIEIHALQKQYGDFTAVDSLSFEVHAGEVFGFLGPNGAGKTTTIRMLMGILVASGGSARIDGLDCFKDRVELKRRVGYLPDVPAFHDYLRGREIVEFVARMHGLDAASARSTGERLLGSLGLGDDGEEFAVNYSLGMKKKLALACALVHEPKVLILDEPTSGLDPRASRDVRERLTKIAAEGRTILISTHFLDLAERLCTRVGIIDHGRLVACGSLAELKERVAQGGSLEDVFLRVTAAHEQAQG